MNEYYEVSCAKARPLVVQLPMRISHPFSRAQDTTYAPSLYIVSFIAIKFYYYKISHCSNISFGIQSSQTQPFVGAISPRVVLPWWLGWLIPCRSRCKNGES